MSPLRSDLAKRFLVGQNPLKIGKMHKNVKKSTDNIVFQFYKQSVRKEYEQHWDEEVD